MSEYNLGITDVLDGNTQNVRGFLVSIEPPVNLNPEAVNAAITRDTLNPDEPSSTNTTLERATVIGSSDTHTAIYVSLPHVDGYDGNVSEVMGDYRDDIVRGIKVCSEYLAQVMR